MIKCMLFLQKRLIAEKIVVECDIASLNYALFAQSNRLTIQSNLYRHHAPSIVFPVVNWISVYIKVDMGERRKTLKIWLKRMWDKSGVEDTRPKAKDTKNIRGQRQPFRGETLSRAKTQAQVFSKEIIIRSLKIFFTRLTKRSSKVFFRWSQKNKIKKSPKNKLFYKKNDLQNFKDSKNTDVLELRTGQFSRTWGFEAKDFKMCPRGLHLCKRDVTVELKNNWNLKTKCTLQSIAIRSFHRVTLR